MARETGLWKWLKKAIVVAKTNLDMNRIENSVMSGMPDVEGHYKNTGQFWLELKMAKRPARATTKVRPKVREGQVEWLTKRWHLGGNAWILLQVGSGSEKKLYMIPGKYSRAVEQGQIESWFRQHDVLRSAKPTPLEVVLKACLERNLYPSI